VVSVWFLVAAPALSTRELVVLGLPLVAAFVLSLVIHQSRLKSHRRTEAMRYSDEKYKEKLANVLRNAELRYRQIVETAYEGICLTDVDGKLTYINPRLLAMLDFSENELLARAFSSLVHEDDRDRVRQQSDSRRTAGAEQYECRFLRSDGSFLWCLVSESPVFGLDEEFVGVLALISDVSQRRSSEQVTRMRLKVEHFLGSISRRFIDPRDFDQEVSDTLAQVGQLLSASRVYLFRIRDHWRNLKNTHEWCDETVTPRIQSLQSVPAKDLKWWMDELKTGHTIVVEDAELMCDEAKREKLALGHTRLQSVIVSPIYLAGEPAGFLGIDNPSTPHINIVFAEFILNGVAGTLSSGLYRRKADARYRRLFERNLAGVFRSTLDGRLLDCNASFSRMFGYSGPAQAVENSTVSLYIHAEDREEFIQRLLEKKKLGDFEWQGRRFDGSIGWFLEASTIVPDESGTLSIIEGTTFDITDRKKAEQAREQFAGRLQALHEVGRSIVAADSPRSIAEKALSRLIDLIPSDYVCVVLKGMPDEGPPDGMSILSFEKQGIVEHQLAKETVDNCKACTLGESIHVSNLEESKVECGVVAAIDAKGVCSVVCEPMVLHDNPLGSLLLFSRQPDAFNEEHIDIASELAGLLSVALHESRLRHDAELERGRFESIVEHLPEAVFVLDDSGCIQFCNPAAEKQIPLLADARTGDLLDSVAGMPLADLFLTPPEGGWHFLKTEVDQKTYHFEAVARYFEPRGPQQGSIVVIRDVTNEREVQQRVQGQERLAAVGQLAAGIAHDFNNVLQSIMMAGEILMDDPDVPEEHEDTVTTVVEQTKRGANLVRQILDFSRKSVRTREALDLAELLKEMMRLLKRTIREDIRVRFEIDSATEDFIVLADPTQIQQAVTNLVLNAQDAMPGKGELSISLAVTEFKEDQRPLLPGLVGGPWVEVRVSDTGSGIPLDVQKHIFEPFFTTKSPGRGTGLGLAQVYGIVKQNEGFIDFITTPGKGTTFRLFFLKISDITMPGRVMEETNIPKGNGELILVVEDAAPLLRVVSHALSSYGYRVVATDQVNEAVDICRRLGNDVDLVLSDVVMPEKSGPELLATIRPLCPHAKFILMSGYGRDESNSGVPSHTLSDWLEKPFSVNELVEKVSGALASGCD